MRSFAGLLASALLLVRGVVSAGPSAAALASVLLLVRGVVSAGRR